MINTLVHRLFVAGLGALFSGVSAGTIIFLHEIIVVVRRGEAASPLGMFDLRFLLVAFLFLGALQQVLNRWGPVLVRLSASHVHKTFFGVEEAGFSQFSSTKWMTFVECAVLLSLASFFWAWDWYLFSVVSAIALSAISLNRAPFENFSIPSEGSPGGLAQIRSVIFPAGSFLAVVLVAAVITNPLSAWRGDSVFLFLFVLHRLVALEARLLVRSSRD